MAFSDIFSSFGGSGTSSIPWQQLIAQLGHGLIGAKDFGSGLQTGVQNLGQYAQRQQYQDSLSKMFAPGSMPNEVAVTPQTGPLGDTQAQSEQRQAANAVNAKPFSDQGMLAGSNISPLLPFLQQLDPQSALPLLLKADTFNKKPERILSQQEAKDKNLPNWQNQTYSVGEDGVPKPVGNSDVMSPEAMQQKADYRATDPQLDLERQRLAETRRHNQAAESASDTPPDPNTVKYWAQSVAGGAPMPTLGMGKQAAGYRQAILSEVAKMQTASGKSGADQNAVTGSYKANVSTLAKITPLRAATEAYENTMLQNMDAAKQMIAKGAGTTGVPVINRWQRYIKGEYKGDPDVAAFNTAIQTVKNEYAKIQSGSIGNTPVSDASRKEAEGMVNPNMTPQQIMANFDYMTKETGNRARALRAQEGALRTGLSGGSDLPNIPGIHDPQSVQAPGQPAAKVIDFNSLPQ